jgi:hypothetical protein
MRKKKNPGEIRGFLFLLVFLRVVLENPVFGCGVFVVKLWWMRGKTWFVDRRFSVVKNAPGF